MQIVKMSDIKIPQAYAKTIPKEEKINRCREFWGKFKAQDRFLVLTKNNNLIDGYIQYLVLIENNIDEAEVLYINKPHTKTKLTYRDSETIYVYGKHVDNAGNIVSPEYVWRIPRKWAISDNSIVVGDLALAWTKFGISRIIITRIEKTNKCPTELPVKKIVKILTKQRCN